MAMSRTILWVGVVFAVAGSAARAEEPVVVTGDPVVPASGFHHRHVAPLCSPSMPGYPVYPDCPPLTPGTPGMPPGVTPGMPPEVPPGAMPPDLSGLTTPFATGTEGGGLQGRAFNESFDGDFGGIFYRKTVIVGTHSETRQTGIRVTVTTRPNPDPEGPPIRVVIRTPVFSTFTFTDTKQVLVPVPGRYSGISITDNDSPKPTDRLYFNYGYYDGLNAQLTPGVGNITMNRPVMGFEKTFLGGDASIGM